MNSLVGKWAAHGRSWNPAPGEALLLPWQTTYRRYCAACAAPVPSKHEGICDVCLRCGGLTDLRRYRSIGWHVQRLDVSAETPESCPALAAWTYSVGRCRLQQWMDTAGAEDTYYVDSDSIYCSAAGADRLVHGGHVRAGHMGALRLQGVYPTLRIGGIRDYTAGARRVLAGIPHLRVGDDGAGAAYWQPETVREAVDAQHRPGPEARYIEVPLYREYRHGTVGADGRVSPLRVERSDDDA
jgi:hypothetical protein